MAAQNLNFAIEKKIEKVLLGSIVAHVAAKTLKFRQLANHMFLKREKILNLYVCVCVCVREGERETEREGKENMSGISE